MRAGLLLTGNGALVFLTSHDEIVDKSLVEKLDAKGISKFIVYEIPVEKAAQRYGGHYQAVVRDLHESDHLRILDYEGNRALSLFSFEELGKPIFHEPLPH